MLLSLATWAGGCEPNEAPSNPVDAAVPARPPRERPKPTRVANRAGALSVGNTHACVVTEHDRLICWGDDRYGHLLDGAQGRVAEVAAGSLGHVALLRDGDLQAAPDFEGEIHEAPFYGVPVPAQPGPRGVRISYGQGRDAQGCLVKADGQLMCEFQPRSYFESFFLCCGEWEPFMQVNTSHLAQSRWTGITPHAHAVGCGWRAEGGPACWTLGLETTESYGEQSHRFVHIPPLHEAHFEYRTGSVYEMPEDTEHLCASPYMACSSRDGQNIQCWRAAFGSRIVDRGQQYERELGTHALEAIPFLDEPANRASALACGATSGPLLSPPPYRAAVCLAEPEGVRCRIVGDDLAAEPTWTPHFGGVPMRHLDTNGLVVCGVDLQGKVRCEALSGALPTRTEIGLLTVRGLLDVPPALRP